MREHIDTEALTHLERAAQTALRDVTRRTTDERVRRSNARWHRAPRRHL